MGLSGASAAHGTCQAEAHVQACMRVVQQEWIPSLQGVQQISLRLSAAALAWTMGAPSMDRPPDPHIRLPV